MRKYLLAGCAVVSTLLCGAGLGEAPGTVDRVKTAGTLACGLVTEEPEYSNLDAHGNRAAFDVDLCKAVAVAVLGSSARFNMTPYPDETRAIDALLSGAIVLVTTGTPGFATGGAKSLAFGQTILPDFQGLMVNRASGVRAPQDLAGKKVCYLAETDIEVRMQNFVRQQKINIIPFPFQEEGEMEAAFITNNCAAISADVTQLAYERIAFRSMAKNYEILPAVVAKDPLAPMTLRQDPHWTLLVNRVAEVLREAEVLGIRQGNVAEMKKSTRPEIRQLLGVTAGVGREVGLDDGWAARVIEAVGNYGEVYARDLGEGSPMRLPRASQRAALGDGTL